MKIITTILLATICTGSYAGASELKIANDLLEAQERKITSVEKTVDQLQTDLNKAKSELAEAKKEKDRLVRENTQLKGDQQGKKEICYKKCIDDLKNRGFKVRGNHEKSCDTGCSGGG